MTVEEALLIADDLPPAIDGKGHLTALAVLAKEVRRLNDSCDVWADQCSQRTDDVLQFAAERDAARAELAAARERFSYLLEEAVDSYLLLKGG